MSAQGASPYAPPLANLDSGGTPVGALTMATAGSRLAAILIDAALMLPLVVGSFFLAQLIDSPTGGRPPSAERAGWMLYIGFIAYFLGAAIYQMVMLSKRGQTLGKRTMKIRIVKLDGSGPGFLHAVLLRLLVNALPSAIPVVGVLYPLVDYLFIFRADRRCLHDRIAGTRVVQVDEQNTSSSTPGR